MLRTSLQQRLLYPLLFLLLTCPLPAQSLTEAQVAERLAMGAGLEGADLRCLPLRGVELLAVRAPGSVWDQADLSGARLRGVNLREASLAGAILRGAILEQVDLTGASLTGADLSAVRMNHVNLAGADLSGARLNGAEAYSLRFSPAGDRYLPALAVALSGFVPGISERPDLALAWAAGLSVTAFSFVYDPEKPGLSPVAPVTVQPLVGAFEQAGATAALRDNLDRGRAFMTLNRSLSRGETVLVALDMSHPGMTGTALAEPVWGVVERIEGKGDQALCLVQAPPFGRLALPAGEMEMRWQKEGQTLRPAGQGAGRGRYLILTLEPGARRLTRQQMAFTAIQKAVEALSGVGYRGNAPAGVAGLRRLLAEMQAAAESGDPARLAALAAWGGTPRQDLAGARRLAAQFLSHAAAVFPTAQAALLEQAANLYLVESYALENQWADLSLLDPTDPEESALLIQQDLDVLAEAVSAEEQALALLQRVAAME